MCSVRGALLVVVIALLATACSNDSGETQPAAFPGAGVDCPTEEPRPVSAEAATEALADTGFSVQFSEEACGLGEISGMLSNSSRSAAQLEEEGAVVCFLFVRPRTDGAVPEVAGSQGGAHAERSFANIACDLYAARAPAEDEFNRFDQAFENLRKAG